MKRIGYACLGRTIKFNPDKFGFQGDAEKTNLLYRLARRNPDVTWVVVGHNDGTVIDLPNVENPWTGARQRAVATPPRPAGQEGFYRTPFEPYWTGKPAWSVSETTGFEDDLVELISDLDGLVVHVGQHAPTQIRIPQAKNTWQETFDNPNLDGNRVYDSMQVYCRYLVRGMNALGDKTIDRGLAPVVWLVPDPRNYLKARDVKWHSGTWDVLSQYQFSRRQRHERFLDPRTPKELIRSYGRDWLPTGSGILLERDDELWLATHRYRHCDLELMMLPDDWDDQPRNSFEFRLPAGVATTSTKASVLGEGRRRSRLVADYLLAAFPNAEVFGKWDAASLEDVPENTVQETTPNDFYDLLNRWRVTLSLPIVESGWSVAKGYQCWAAGVVCLMVEQVDEQGWTLPSRRQTPEAKIVGEVQGQKFWSVRDDWTKDDVTLASWLRVETPAEFAQRARFVASDDAVWAWLARAQLDLLKRRWDAKLLETTIERKLGIV